MKELRDLAKIITSENLKANPLISLDVDAPATKEQKLFDGVKMGSFDTDEQASKAIYGDGAGNSNPSYVMLKVRLKKKMLNHLFFLDFTDKGQNTIRHYLQECMNLLHYSKMLRFKGEFALAEKQAVKAVEMAKKGEYAALVVQGLEQLQFLYVHNNQPKNYQLVMDELPHYRQISQWESEANDLYLSTKLLYNKSVKQRNDALEELPILIQQLEALWKKAGSIAIFERYYKLKTWYLEMINDFEAVLVYTKEVESLIKEGKLNLLIYDQTFNIHIRLYAYLRTKRYEEGIQFAETHLDIFIPSNRDWFAFMENYLLIAIHGQQYELAENLYATVSLNSSRHNLAPMAKERWSLYAAYLHLVLARKPIKGFDYNAFVDALPHYRKDKAGFNVAILILQFIYHLKQDNMDVLINRIEAMDDYIFLHLRDSFSDRSRTFFRLMKIMVDCGLNRADIEVRSKYLIKKLKELPVPGDAYAEIEIIPYEHLWVLCLDSLKSNKVAKAGVVKR